MAKRICFYFLKKGATKVDTYIIQFLKELSLVTERLIVIGTGKLEDVSEKNVSLCTDGIEYDSENNDVFEKYKTEIMNYDEWLFCDDTFMGPVYSFFSMFDEMHRRGAQAWNIYHVEDSYFDGFFVLQNSVIPVDVLFKSIRSRTGALYKVLEESDIQVQSYMDLKPYYHLTDKPMMLYPAEIIQKQKCPVFDYRIFTRDYYDVLETADGKGARKLYDYLKKETGFNLDVLWDKLLSDVNQADLFRNLNLNYVLSGEKKAGQEERNQHSRSKTVLIMHLYYDDLIPVYMDYASHVPENTDIYITTDTLEKQRMIEKNIDVLKPRAYDIRIIPNRGRDISSLLVGVKDVIMQYDYACFVHDKKTTQVNQGSVGHDFASRIIDNTLYSKEYIEQIIDLFDCNPRLGILSPAIPNHSDYFPTLGQEWGVNFQNTKQLAQELQLDVPIDEKKEPVAPFGTCFWFRVKAMKPLYAKDWEFKDFPEEPNGTDGTILHAIERIYPYAVQSAGYYPAFVLEQSYAETEMTNLQFYVREYNTILLGHGYGGRIRKMSGQLREALNGGKTPVQKMLQEYAEALTKEQELSVRYKEAHDRVNEEWKKTAEAYESIQSQYNDLQNSYEKLNQLHVDLSKSYEYVNEEWRKTAEAYEAVNKELAVLNRKYIFTLRGFIEAVIKFIRSKRK